MRKIIISETEIVDILKSYFKSDEVALFEKLSGRLDRISNWNEKLEIVAQITTKE